MRHGILDWTMIVVGYACLGTLIGIAFYGGWSMVKFVFSEKEKNVAVSERIHVNRLS